MRRPYAAQPSRPATPPATQPATRAYLRTAQVAELMGLSPKTVSRYAKEGKLPFLRTLGGHRRYPEDKIRELVAASIVRPSDAATRRLHP